MNILDSRLNTNIQNNTVEINKTINALRYEVETNINNLGHIVELKEDNY